MGERTDAKINHLVAVDSSARDLFLFLFFKYICIPRHYVRLPSNFYRRFATSSRLATYVKSFITKVSTRVLSASGVFGRQRSVNRYSCVKQLEDRQASCIHLTGPASPRRSCGEKGVCMKIQARLAGIRTRKKRASICKRSGEAGVICMGMQALYRSTASHVNAGIRVQEKQGESRCHHPRAHYDDRCTVCGVAERVWCVHC